MPKGTRRTTSAIENIAGDSINDANGVSRNVPRDQTRNIVGDQGAEKVRAGGVATSSSEQETPTARRKRLKAKMDAENSDLLGRVKSAMSKKGGPLVQSNYED